MTLIICDIDGTISNCQHRQHLAAAGDWDAFHQLAHLDEPILHVKEFIYSRWAAGDAIVFLTGRPEWMRSVTIKWLYEKCKLSLHDHYEDLIMRPKDEWKSDVLLKKELLLTSARHGYIGRWLIGVRENTEDIIKPTKFLKDNILFLDDREKVVAMWRDLGYACWQTAEGAF